MKANVFISDGVKRCEPSAYILNQVAAFLALNGHVLCDAMADCNTVIVNTCCVTESKIKDSNYLIEKALKQSNAEKVIILGCLAKTTSKYRPSDRLLLVGSKELYKLNHHFTHEHPIETVSPGELPQTYFKPYQSAITNNDPCVMISQGCRHACSYCNIKRSKADVTSRSISQVTTDIRPLVEAGAGQIVLLADDCGSYGRDIGVDIVDLLQVLLLEYPLPSFKISSIFPGDLMSLLPRFLPILASGRISYINIPLQSACPRILGLMNRGYDAAGVLNAVDQIRQISPGTWLYTHILFNFPTESNADFELSLDASAGFDETMFISYSENSRTVAARIAPKVPQKDQIQRLQRIKTMIEQNDRNGIIVDSRYSEIAEPEPERAVAGDHHRRVVQLTLTNRCQCNCSHCGVKHLNRALGHAEPDLWEIKEMFRDFKTSGFSSVDLFGGEPTLRKDLPEIITIGRRFGLEMLVETNGLELDRDYLIRLKNAGVFRIYISLDDYNAKYHDRNRGQKCFQHAVKVLTLCRHLNIQAHTSIVPRDREYFLDGEINRYIRFCLDKGAASVRILFPSYVGNCTDNNKIFCSNEDELFLLSHVDAQYRHRTYVESQAFPLDAVLKGRPVKCPAKQMFCHVTASGLVMPCPYLPLVFGDVKRESITEIFSRMMDHPLLRKPGLYCPSRDIGYMEKWMDTINAGNPCTRIASNNRIDLQSKCNNNCDGCCLAPAQRTGEAIIDQLEKLDNGYGAVHLFGGEPFLRQDIFDLLTAATQRCEAVLHTNARIFYYPGLAAKVSKFRIRAVKVPFFSFDEKRFDAHTKVPGSYGQTLSGIRNLADNGIPVCIYTPEHVSSHGLDLLSSLGIVSISRYHQARTGQCLEDTVLCFGTGIGRTRLIWRRK